MTIRVSGRAVKSPTADSAVMEKGPRKTLVNKL